MKAITIITGVVGIFVAMPIWYYLLYKILASVNATELMWFLYWIYLPVGLLVQIVTKIAESNK